MSDRLGLHVRLYDSIFDALDRAQKLEIRNIQSFLMTQDRKYIDPKKNEIEKFKNLCKNQIDRFFVHCAYWSQITDSTKRGFKTLKKEIHLAESLGAAGVVIHPGSFHHSVSQNRRVKIATESVKMLLDESENMTLLFENIPHAGKSFTGSLDEYQMFFEAFENEDRVQMCVDTAHAYAYGYDIVSSEGQEQFIDQLKSIGTDKIGLIHCNDTVHKLGSRIDKHAVPGEGCMGFDPLHKFVNNDDLKHIPVIFELPEIVIEKENKVIKKFNESSLL